jgi:microcystin degradation protein MlrC
LGNLTAFLLKHGIDVRECALVCVKSSTHFRAAYAPLAQAIITADEPVPIKSSFLFRAFAPLTVLVRVYV